MPQLVLASQPRSALKAPCRAKQPSLCARATAAAGHRRPARLAVAAAQRRQPVVAAASKAPPVSLTLPNGTTVAMPQQAITIGSSAKADLQLEGGANLAAQHARLEHRGGRLFVTALAADPDLLLAPTHCWLDGVELRPGVNYMVAPGTKLAVGSPGTVVVCNFEEAGGSSAVSEMLMKGLAASASKEVQEKLDKDL